MTIIAIIAHPDGHQKFLYKTLRLLNKFTRGERMAS